PSALPSPHNTLSEGTGAHPTSKQSAMPQPAAARGLVLVATPIGNADDITQRALATLRQADVIACEDTRTTGALMARYGIATPLVAYHQHNAPRMRPLLLERLRRGGAGALGSGARPPPVSPPGHQP